MKNTQEPVVTVETVDAGCGSTGHMTVDQIKSRIRTGYKAEMTCPACGRIHLTEEDVAEAEAVLVTGSDRYRQIQNEAEEDLTG